MNKFDEIAQILGYKRQDYRVPHVRVVQVSCAKDHKKDDKVQVIGEKTIYKVIKVDTIKNLLTLQEII